MASVSIEKNFYEWMPVDSGSLRPNQKEIIHKRLCKQALNPSEKLQHAVFMRRIFSQDHPIHARPNEYSVYYHALAKRVLHLNGSLFYDLTTVGGLSVIEGKPQLLGWKKMAFYFAGKDQRLDVFVFGKKYFTDYGFVQDGLENEQIQVVEFEVPRSAGVTPIENSFVVDTRYHLVVQDVDASKKPGRFLIARNSLEKLEPSSPKCAELAKQLPVDDSMLTDDQIDLLDAVVTGVILESEDHEELLYSNKEYESTFIEKQARIHRFPGDKNVIVMDLTLNGLGGTTYAPEFNYDAITLRGHIVFVPKCPRGALRRSHYTRGAPGCIDFITIRNADRPNHVLITEFMLPGIEQPAFSRSSLVNISDSNLTPYSQGTKMGYHAIEIHDLLPKNPNQPKLNDGEEKEEPMTCLNHAMSSMLLYDPGASTSRALTIHQQ